MKHILSLSIVTVLLGCVFTLPGQVRMESLTVAEGLSQGYVTAVLQDEKGYIWMGTFDGLNRYDGYVVRHFKAKPFDSLSIQSSYISFLYEDAQHFLWVGTTEGLYLFDPLKERFYNMSGHILPRQQVRYITGDKAGNVFVQFMLERDPVGIYQLTPPANFSKVLASTENPTKAIAIQSVGIEGPSVKTFSLMSCIGDTMPLAHDDASQVYRFNYPNRRFAQFDLRQIPAAASADHNILWGRNESYVFRQRLPDGRDSILPVNRWATALQLGNGRIGLWFITRGPLLVVKENKPFQINLNLQVPELLLQPYMQDQFTTLVHGDGPPGVPEYWSGNLFADKSGVLWLGTSGWGVRKVNPRQIVFGQRLTGQSVSSIRELPGGQLWVRLYSDETLVLNQSSSQLAVAPWDKALNHQILYEVCTTKNNSFWGVIARKSAPSRLFHYDPANEKLVYFTESMPFLQGVPEKIIEDRNGNIWIGAHNGVLYRCRPGQQKLDHFSYANLIPGGNTQVLRTTAILQDNNGLLWVGTNLGVLRIENPNGSTPHFSWLRHDNQNPSTISIDWVTSIAQDPADPNVLWLGTRGGGLNRMHTPTQTFTYWSEAPNELPDNVVYGILPDQQGNLWCSTNRGICRFSPRQNTFSTYQESDGLCSTEFNTNSFLKTSDGRFWFGGVKGLNVFNPAEILPQNAPPPVAITGIKVSGAIRFPDEEGLLSLPFKDNNVLFEFAAFDFANPATNRFRHRLRGIDRDWVTDGTQHSTNYVALPPGRYLFELQGATADSPWSTKTVVFTLVIQTPWYRSRLAYLLYLLLAGGAIFGYIRYREHIFKLENTAKLNQRESERLKEFEALKNQFFANVAHELRTPLTVIAGLAKRLFRGANSESVQQNAAQIINQSDQLLQLSNQVLDLARLETNQFQLHPKRGNIAAFIELHTMAFVPLAANNHIRLTSKTNSPEIWIDFDPAQLQKILNNLISNAIRHTGAGGDIVVETSVPENGEYLRVSVSDTGEGISAEDLPHVFERYYQGHTPNKVGSSGIGLTLSRDLVTLMGGQMAVESTPGMGTTFSFLLPMVRQLPDSSMQPAAIQVPAALFAPKPGEELPLLLVIEDNPAVSDFLQLCLQPYFRLENAFNGQQGIDKALQIIPDIILTDVAMPLKNGYEVTSALKSDVRTSHIPIAILTAKTEANDRMESHRRGANAYLSKPFDESELLLVLHNLLHLQQQWKSRYAGFPQTQPALASTSHPAEEVQQEDQFMQKVNGIFEAHFAHDTFNLDALCRLLNMSSSQLDRKVKALTSQSPMQMLRTFRLQKAQAMLRKDPNITIKEVCFRTGFKSPAHFSRLYSKEFGAPPSAG